MGALYSKFDYGGTTTTLGIPIQSFMGGRDSRPETGSLLLQWDFGVMRFKCPSQSPENTYDRVAEKSEGITTVRPLILRNSLR